MTQPSAVDIVPTGSENDVFNTLNLSSKDYKAQFVTTSRFIVQRQFEFVYLQFLCVQFQRSTS